MIDIHSVIIFIGYGFVCWLSGYGSGILFRYIRQLFESAARGG